MRWRSRRARKLPVTFRAAGTSPARSGADAFVPIQLVSGVWAQVLEQGSRIRLRSSLARTRARQSIAGPLRAQIGPDPASTSTAA